MEMLDAGMDMFGPEMDMVGPEMDMLGPEMDMQQEHTIHYLSQRMYIICPIVFSTTCYLDHILTLIT